MKTITKLLLSVVFMAPFGSSFAQSRTNTLTNGLVAYYPLNGDINDYSQYKNNLKGQNITFSGGVRNGNLSCYLDGNKTLVSTKNIGISGNSHRTISLWIKPLENIHLNSYGYNESTLLYWGHAGEGDWNHAQTLGLSADSFWSDWANKREWAEISWTTNHWMNLVYVYSGNQETSAFYLNGSLQTSRGGVNYMGVSETDTGDSPVTIGELVGLKANYSSIRIYNRALTASEVAQLYLQESNNMVFVQGGTLPSFSQLSGQRVQTFQISKYETTWGEWKTVRAWAAANGYDIGSSGQGSGDNQPIRNVNWYDVVKWCNAKSQMEGLTPVYTVNGETYKTGQIAPTQIADNGYRLPSESEWEWAARGGTLSKGFIYSGSDDINAVAWFLANSPNSTSQVGTKLPNELGIYDMNGNVWEFCFDLVNGSRRRLRGGSWSNLAQNCTVSDRYNHIDPSDARYSDLGFRLARNGLPNSSIAGIYNGLIGTGSIGTGSAADIASFSGKNGFLSVNLASNNSYTGILRIEGRSHPFSGSFTPGRTNTVTVTRPGRTSAVIAMESVTSPAPGSLSGTVTIGTTKLDFVAPLNSYTQAAQHPLAGKRYTLTLVRPSGITQGNGSAQLAVSRDGSAVLSGRLPTGGAVAAGGRLVDDGVGNWILPVYVSSEGVVTGEIVIPKVPATGSPAVTGTLSWLRAPNAAAKLYKSGFLKEISVTGSLRP
jgi:sulfatase modifying factor 1